MDAIFFRDPVVQYDIPNVKRELIKAYAAFRPRATTVGAENLFGIATGNWGCGVFNGDKQLKGIYEIFLSYSFFLRYFLSDYSINGCFRSSTTTYLCSLL